LRHTNKILAEMDAAREGLAELGKWGHGRLRIGTSLTACQYILPAVLWEFKESFPECVIHIEAGDTLRMLELLDQGRIDLALALEPRAPGAFEFEEVFQDELLFHTSPLHPWALAGKVDRNEVPRQRFILYTKNSYLFQMVEQYFRNEGLVLPTSVEIGNIEAIKELVKVGLGISVLAPWVAHKELTEGSLKALHLGRAKLRRRWGILSRHGARFNLQQATFIRLCRAVTENLICKAPPQAEWNAAPHTQKASC
jgi:DNA-binding transcriptional LysR family regulator